MAVLGVLTQIVLVLLIGIILKTIGDKIKFPSIVLVILGGTFLASYALVEVSALEPLPELIRTIALIVIVFNSTFYLKLGSIKKESRPILLLATLGILITGSIIALTTYQLLSIPLLTAALLGALLCGTDPAVISSQLKKKQGRVMTVLGAESIFNTPLTVILPLFLLGWITAPGLAWLSIPKFFVLIIVGTIVGLVGYGIGREILKYSSGHHETIALLIVLLVYVIAENLYGSGILAVVVCSLLLTSGKLPQKRELGQFNKELAFLFTLLVFGMLGAEFSFSDLIVSRIEIITVVIALFVGRLISSFVVLQKSGFTLKEKALVGLIAPRGIAPAAIAPLLLGVNLLGAEIAVKIVFYAVILSIFFSLIVLKLSVQKQTEKEKTSIQKLKEEKEKKLKASKPLLK